MQSAREYIDEVFEYLRPKTFYLCCDSGTKKPKNYDVAKNPDCRGLFNGNLYVSPADLISYRFAASDR
ncbi:hypothetical protein H6F74_07460 [Trichocoleus sp. FACHB-90]|uniref:hypothetical protein n=1 Tax=Cyanophyceae TaxID=3028117 RepID=UPI00168222FA|nr:hypothetical protein [Trichocoleus sp. FACHB-90]MBD1926091.1 hypothetical protein [Trichocoleus sp. FACHB-90]